MPKPPPTTEPTGQAALDALPPPGDARRDEQARRADALAAQAEQVEGGSVDPSALQIDNEIAIEIVKTKHNRLEVMNAQPGYRYLLCRAYDEHGRPRPELVDLYRAITVRIDGAIQPAWEIVSGSMPEAPDWRDVSGQRKLGDCILLRCRQDVFDALERHRDVEQRRLAGKRVDDLAGTVQRELKGAATLTAWQVPESSGLARPADMFRLRQEAARQGATQQFDRMLRAGDVPGMPATQTPR